MKTARFPIGLSFTDNRTKRKSVETITDIFTTTDSKGLIVKIEYKLTHDFCGQPVSHIVGDCHIARRLTAEQLAEFVQP